jgi:ubiquinone/menaquinone biosynthesis C-methylase UbiE
VRDVSAVKGKQVKAHLPRATGAKLDNSQAASASGSDEDTGTIRILDVGCGAGDSLREELEARLTVRNDDTRLEMVGLDLDEESLAQGRVNFPQFVFVQGRGEELPFSDQRFDVVISRVAMCYMDIPVALREMRRVLKVGGELKLKLHPYTFTVAELRAEIKAGPLWRRVQAITYRSYVLANGVALHFGGSNFRFPLSRRHCESFQTREGMRRVLSAANFGRIDVSCWDTCIEWPHAGNCRVSAFRETI